MEGNKIGEMIKAHPQLAIIGLVGLGIVMFLLAGKSGGSAFKPPDVPKNPSNPPPNDYISSAMMDRAIQDALDNWGAHNPPPGEPPPMPLPGGEGGGDPPSGEGGPPGPRPGPGPLPGGEGDPSRPHPHPHWGG